MLDDQVSRLRVLDWAGQDRQHALLAQGQSHCFVLKRLTNSLQAVVISTALPLKDVCKLPSQFDGRLTYLR